MDPEIKRLYKSRVIAALLFAGILFCSFDQMAGSSIEKLSSRNGISSYPTILRDTGVAEGYILMYSSDCYTCHADYKVLNAPSFSDIAGRYKTDKDAIPKLSIKVISGSVGTWGDKPMPPHPELLQEDVQKMLQYIMSLNQKKDSTKLLLKES